MKKAVWGGVLFLVLSLVSTPAAAQGFPQDKCPTLQQLEERFGQLNHGSEDQRREFARIAAEQFAFSWPTEGWGSKATGPSAPQTKDALARRANGVFEGWDLVNGTTRRVTCNGTRHDLTGQHFIAVTPRDHLGGGNSGGGGGNGGGGGTGGNETLDAIAEHLRRLHERLDVIDGRLQDLELRVQHTDEVLTATSTDIRAAILEIRSRPWPEYTARILGQTVVFRPTGR